MSGDEADNLAYTDADCFVLRSISARSPRPLRMRERNDRDLVILFR